jgi:alkylhydroperoxidase family enzyme
MFILNHVKPEDATGKVAEAYAVIPPGMPLPEPLLMMSASPDLVHLWTQNFIRYFRNHDRLDMGLMAAIRYLVSCDNEFDACINFNAGILQAGGVTPTELAAMKADPEQAPLEESQKELLLFVLKVIKTPEKVTAADVAKLHESGWRDQDIFDASFIGAFMKGLSILGKAFVK